MSSLLPSNATPLERALDACFSPNLDLDALRGFKFQEAAIPYIFEDLIAEYGLESVRLWISDPARILTEGILFQRLRGTPAAMKMALGWANLGGVTVEEGRPGQHFAEFQLGIEELPANLSLEAVVELANHAKPVRSRLTRLFNSQYDRRHLILDENTYGDFLDGESGVQVGDLFISFGRHSMFEADGEVKGTTAVALTRGHTLGAVHGGIFRLDESCLDEDVSEILTLAFVHEHSFAFETVERLEASLEFRSYTQTKSQMTLDNGFVFGSENIALGAYTTREVGGVFRLDEDLLDEHVWRQERVPILERGTNFYGSKAHYQGEPSINLSWIRPTIIEVRGDSAVALIRRTTAMTVEARYDGVLFWHSWKHLDRPWSEEEPIVKIGFLLSY